MTDVTVNITEIQVVEVSTSDNISVVEVTIPGPQGPAGGGGGIVSLTPWTENVDANGFNLLFDDGTGILSSEVGNPELVIFSSVASAVNYLQIANAATGTNPTITAAGSDTNIGINFAVQGSPGNTIAAPAVKFDIGGASFPFFEVSGTYSVDGGPGIVIFHDSASPAVSDSPALLSFAGRDSAANTQKYCDFAAQILDPTSTTEDGLFKISATVAGTSTSQLRINDGVGVGSTSPTTWPGNGNVAFATGKGIFDADANEWLLFSKTASAVNYLQIANAATGNTPTISAAGDDANIGLAFTAKGSPGTSVTFNMGAANYTDFVIQNTGTGAGANGGGPGLVFQSQVNGAGNVLYYISAYGKDSVGNTQNYSDIFCFLEDPTNLSEDAYLDFRVRRNNVSNTSFMLADGILVGNSGTFPGFGNLAFATGKGIFDNGTNEQLLFSKTASAVNYLQIANAATGNAPNINAAGDDANIGLLFTAKGALSGLGSGDCFKFDCGTGNFPHITFTMTNAGAGSVTASFYNNSASPAAVDAVGEFDFEQNDSLGNRQVYGSLYAQILDPTSGSEDGELILSTTVASAEFVTQIACGNGVKIGSGSITYPGDGNIGISTGKGIFDANANEQILFSATASAVNYLQIANAATGTTSAAWPTLTAAGGDTNIGLKFVAKGSPADATDGGSAFSFDGGSADWTSIILKSAAATSAGPGLATFANSASPAASDYVGFVAAYGRDSGGTDVVPYCEIDFKIADPTNLSEDGYFEFRNRVNGVGTTAFTVGNGAVLADFGSFTMPGAGNLGVQNGKGIFDANANEQILFSTTASAVNYLNVTNSATTNYPKIDAAGSDTNIGMGLFIKGTGQILLGESHASAITMPQSNSPSMVDLAGTTAAVGFAARRHSNTATPARSFFAKSRGTTVTDMTIVQSGDGLGEFDFCGSDGTNFLQAAMFSATCDGTPGANDMPGRLEFWTTADGASGSTLRMTIKNDGGLILGTGTTSPGAGNILLSTAGSFVRTTATTVASLTAAATVGAGARAFVTDANATTFASVVAGGGANGVPVYSDGTNWRIG